VLGFVVEPALRLGIDLVVVADAVLEDLDEARFVEAEFRYAHALQRLRWPARSPTAKRTAPARLADCSFDADERQREAIEAAGGVMQLIAPAGSGRTAVLVERVRELRRRGVPANTIACVTFNRAAKIELDRAACGRGCRGRPRGRSLVQCLLVDEYQDIEPARELLVRILAVPHDQLFYVGDEDQTLYAFRRAGVERIICLDMLYPALRRIALEIDYCCPATVVAACARLIAHNTVRFPKRIDAAPVVIQHRSSIVRSLTGW
jgi:hypothetical protein